MVISMENSENKVKNTLNQEKVNYKMLIIFIGFALAAGFLGSLLGGNMASFKTLKKTFLCPTTNSISYSLDNSLYPNGHFLISHLL